MWYVQWLTIDWNIFFPAIYFLFLWFPLVRYFALNGSFRGYFFIGMCSFRDIFWCGFCTTFSFMRMLTVRGFPVDLSLFSYTFLFEFGGPLWGTLHRVFFPRVVFVRLLYRWSQLTSFLVQVQVLKFVRFTSPSLLCFLFGWNWNKLKIKTYFKWTLKCFFIVVFNR